MSGYIYTFKKFIRDWMLIIGMLVGAGAYLIYHSMPSLHSAGPVLEAVCTHLQPILLFIMLFLSFCKIEPHQMRPHRWQAWLLLIQTALFVGLALLLVWALRSDGAFARRRPCYASSALLPRPAPLSRASSAATWPEW